MTNAASMMGLTIIQIGTLSMLGLLVLFIALGAMWGVIRGGKRTLIRLATVVVALSIALLLTPVIAKAFMGVKIPGVGDTAGGMIEDALFKSGAGADIAASEPELVNFVKACAVVVLSFAVFFILYFAFKWLSWIVYAILAMKFAPSNKKVRNVDDEGIESFEKVKIKKARWWGLGAGVLTGLVFFAFFMIPVTGTMQTFDAAAKYQPTFANFKSADMNDLNSDGSVKKLYDDIHDINGQIQASAVGKITKYSGLQAFGGAGIGYLSRVKVKGHPAVNVKSDLIKMTHVAKDCMAVAIELQRDGSFIDKLGSWSKKDYEELQRIVDSIFEISFVELAFSYSDSIVEDVVKKRGMLDSVGSFVDDKDERDSFNESMYEGIKILNMPNIRNDLNKAIELMRLLFAKETGSHQGVGFYYDVKDIIDNVDNTEELDEACKNLHDKLKREGSKDIAGYDPNNVKHIKRTNAYQLADTVFGFKLIQKLLGGQGVSDLYQIPLAQYLKVEKNDVTFGADDKTVWSEVSVDGARLYINMAEAARGAIKLVKGNDFIHAIEEMEDDFILSLAGILDILTNSEGIGRFVRTLIMTQVGDLKKNIGENDMVNVDDIIDKLTERIDPNNIDPETDKMYRIEWETELDIIKKMAILVVKFGDGIKADNLLELLELIKDSDLMLEVVVGLVEDLIDGLDADIGFTINDPQGAVEVLIVLAEVSEAIFDYINDENANEYESVDELIEAMGGEAMFEKLAGLMSEGDEPPLVLDVTGLIGEDNIDDFKASLEDMDLGETALANIFALFGL